MEIALEINYLKTNILTNDKQTKAEKLNMEDKEVKITDKVI